MSAAKQLQQIAINDYLRGEVGAKQKHEYIDGSVYAMVDASNNHNLIATNATVTLGGQLRGKPCRVFNSDAKIRVHNSRGLRFIIRTSRLFASRIPKMIHFMTCLLLSLR
ncbi:MAG: Uma2 family endonuclease [Planctomycetota bacterium]|nr:Uma2 family endonuclease [Planctomycetota bacterium]